MTGNWIFAEDAGHLGCDAVLSDVQLLKILIDHSAFIFGVKRSEKNGGSCM